MSIFFPVSEFFENSGKATLLFNEKLRDSIAGFACDLWQDYPAFFTQGSNPVSAFSRGYMNQMCQANPSGFTPPTAPAIPFQGGQCPGVVYICNFTRQIYSISSCALVINDNPSLSRTGPIGPLQELNPAPIPQTSNCNGLSNASLEQLDYVFSDGFGPVPIFNGAVRAVGQPASPPLSLVTFDSVTRADGQPDDCGNLPSEYPNVPPTTNDLKRVVNITNIDGEDNVFNIEYNKISNNYNFPIGFKVNGVNVVLDLGGIHIYGNPAVNKPSTPQNDDSNNPPQPGSDGGNDGVGGDNNTIYDVDYPTIPDITAPETILEAIQYVLCVDGVITVINETLKLIAGASPVWLIIIDILTNILSDICDIEADGIEATVGLPEWYGLKPGQDRPAIVYLWKEFINGKWQRSTYSSTVSNPRQSAIDDINTIVVPDKTMGTFYASATMTDGSRIIATGNTEIAALNNFNFLYNQVDPAFQPANISTKIVTSENQRIEVKTVKLRQIEYYPDGKAAGVNPSILRVINA